MTAYNARPGSTGDLALRHLAAHGPTVEIALAAAIDKEAHELGALLAWPIKQGAIKKEVVGDEWLYSLGDGEPPARLPIMPTAPLTQIVISAPAGSSHAARAVGKAIDKIKRKSNGHNGHSNVISKTGLISPSIAPSEAAAAGQPSGASDGRTTPNDRPPQGMPIALATSSAVEKPEVEGRGLRGKNAALWLTGELAFEAEDGTVIVFDQALAKRMAVFLRLMPEGASTC